MYEVICTTYFPHTQICEHTNTINETVWLCRTYFAITRSISPKNLQKFIRKALYCEFVIIQYKNMTISIYAKENDDSLP